MQVPQTDARGCKRVGVEEHLIKFRSSPNLLNMKKFIRSKMDHIEVSNRATPNATPNAAPDPPAPPNAGRSERIKSDVQPPLPLDPPPPDKPICLNIPVKQEIEDTGYQSDKSPGLDNAEIEKNGETSNEKPADKTKKTICRDYIRGTCKRQGSCKFAHEYDVSQLEGVYTFCHKYQNSVCTFANCKFVHADVFEEQHFYRTGILPAHALAHHKKALQPPPPPPPPEEPHPALQPMAFSNPPPALQPEKENAMISVVPASSVETRAFTDLLAPPTYTSPMKRDWSKVEPFGSPPSDIYNKEPLSKKCKNCDYMEFRLQYNQDKVENMRTNKEEMYKKMTSVDRRSEKLHALMSALVKPIITPKSQSHSNGLSILSGDNNNRAQSLLEQLNTIMQVTNRLSGRNEDQ